MATRTPLVGREAELARLAEARRARRDGPRLDRAALRRGRRRQDAASPRRPPTRPRRSSCAGRPPAARGAPTAPSSRRCARSCAPTRTRSTSAARCAPHLALLLPELGEPAPASDRATLFEAIRCALAQLGRRAPARSLRARRPALVRRGDARAAGGAGRAAAASCRCSWSPPTAPTGSPATTGCGGCATSCGAAGRWTSSRSRRSTATTSPRCSARLLGAPPSPALARAIHDRTRARRSSSRSWPPRCTRAAALRAGRRGLELADGGEVPCRTRCATPS